jgi:hypothetical protein
MVSRKVRAVLGPSFHLLHETYSAISCNKAANCTVVISHFSSLAIKIVIKYALNMKPIMASFSSCELFLYKAIVLSILSVYFFYILKNVDFKAFTLKINI